MAARDAPQLRAARSGWPRNPRQNRPPRPGERSHFIQRTIAARTLVGSRRNVCGLPPHDRDIRVGTDIKENSLRPAATGPTTRSSPHPGRKVPGLGHFDSDIPTARPLELEYFDARPPVAMPDSSRWSSAATPLVTRCPHPRIPAGCGKTPNFPLPHSLIRPASAAPCGIARSRLTRFSCARPRIDPQCRRRNASVPSRSISGRN